MNYVNNVRAYEQAPEGRWPANIIHDGSDVVVSAFPDAKGQQGALDECPEPLKSVVKFALATGLRRSNIINME